MLYAFACVCMWAIVPVTSRMGQTTMDNYQFLFWSSLVSFLVLFSVTAASGNLISMKKYALKDWIFLMFLGFLGSFIYYLFLYLGYARASGMEVLVVQYTWPILIMIFSIFILREKITMRKIVAAAMCFCGVITVLSKGDFKRIDLTNLPVVALVAAGAACFALFSVLSKKVKQEPFGANSVYFLSALLFSTVSMMMFSRFSLPDEKEIISVLLNGVIVNGLSYVFWVRALSLAEASFIAPVTYLTPVMSVFYLQIFYHEPFFPAYGTGFFLVISGGLINSIGVSADL